MIMLPLQNYAISTICQYVILTYLFLLCMMSWEAYSYVYRCTFMFIPLKIAGVC